MHIVFASDRKFVRQLLVASGSAIHASRGRREPIIVHVFDCGIGEDAWSDYESRIGRLAEESSLDVALRRHAIDDAFLSGLPEWNGSRATWARLLMPSLLPDVDSCIYSDCDMLFVSPPAEMTDALKDPNVLIAGHLDPRARTCDEAEWCRRHDLPLDPATHVCAGLLAVNLAAFRAQGILQKCMDFNALYPDAPSDQATLNCVCRGHKGLLPEGWGLFTHECRNYGGAIKSIHFAGSAAWPWNARDCWSHALWLKLLKDEFALWTDFERRVLGLSSARAKMSLASRTQAEALYLGARLANRLGLKIGRGRLQRLASEYAGDRKDARISSPTETQMSVSATLKHGK